MTDVKPKVSACIITYNHEKYIEECLAGALAQKVTFDYEIVISDDKSTDATKEICRSFQARYPFLIRFIDRQENLGILGNWADTINACGGEYIAMCEGDDYWTDPMKLQKQVDFLDKNKNYVMCFHAVNVKNEIEGVNYQYPEPRKSILTFNDLLFKHYIPTCSLMFRKASIPPVFPQWYYGCRMADIPLELMIANNGLTKYFSEKLAVYRKNRESITADRKQISEGRRYYLYVYERLNKHLRYKRWLPLSIMISKVRIGFIKDRLGMNPLLKK